MRHSRVSPVVAAATLLLARGLCAQQADTMPGARNSARDVDIAILTPGLRRTFAIAPDNPAATPHREPLVAGLLGVVPGLGHAYANEPRRGLVVFAVWLGSGMLAFSSSNKVATGAGAVVMLGSYVFSIADASLAAERFNRRHPPPAQ